MNLWSYRSGRFVCVPGAEGILNTNYTRSAFWVKTFGHEFNSRRFHHHVGAKFALLRFSLQKNIRLLPCSSSFAKRHARLKLLTCKRARNVSLSLPPFCESACGANVFMVRLHFIGCRSALIYPICFWKKFLLCCHIIFWNPTDSRTGRKQKKYKLISFYGQPTQL